MSATPDRPTLGDRLRDSLVGVRGDLLATRTVERDVPGYIVEDPLTSTHHHLGVDEYRILISLGARGTLGQTFQHLCETGVLYDSEEDAFYGFVLSLHERNLLHLHVSDDKKLFARHQARLRAERKGLWQAPVFFKTRLVDPDAYLDRTAAFVRPFFTRAAFAVWCLVVLIGAGVAWTSRGDLAAPLSQVLVLDRLPMLWALLVGLKVVHELGHAYACKLLGGRVPEIGVNLIVLTPLPYVDASSSWLFDRKRDRIIVSLAGMYVELFLAAVAVVVWRATDPGLLNACAYQVAMLASLVTLVFNLNPLMRFDGYFVLCDLVEIPNLRQRAQDHARAWIARLTLGMRDPRGEDSRFRPVLFGFGVAGAIYKAMLVLGIAAMVAQAYPWVGLGLAATMVVTFGFRQFKALWLVCFRTQEHGAVRARALVLGLALFLVLPAVLLSSSIEQRLVAPAVLGSSNEHTVRSPQSGFLAAAPRAPGAFVTPGSPIVQIVIADGVDRQLLQARADEAAARLRAHALAPTDPGGSARETLRADQLRDEVERLEQVLDESHVASAIEGRWVEGFDVQDLGRRVEPGDELGTIVHGARRVRVLLTESQMAGIQLQVGLEARFKSAIQPERTLIARLVHWQPGGRRVVERPAFTHLAGGPIPVDPATGEALEPFFELEFELSPGLADHLPHASGGKVALRGPDATLAELGWRRLSRFLQRLNV